MVLSEPLSVTFAVVDALRELDVPYLVGGSLASSLHGVPRSTHDVDLVADLDRSKVDALVARLEQTFYIDRDMILDAIKRRSSFNIIHLETMLKVDIFVLKRTAHAEEEMRRAQARSFSEGELVIAAAEDIILEKLEWFRLGQEVSDRQWTDVLGVLQIQGDVLDHDYLRRWASQLGLEPLLDRALADAKGSEP